MGLPFSKIIQDGVEYDVNASAQVVYADTITGRPSEVLTAISSNVSTDVLDNPRTVIQLTVDGEIYFFHNAAKVRASYNIYNCVNYAKSGIAGYKAVIRNNGGSDSALYSIALAVPSAFGAVQGSMSEETRSGTYTVKVTTM